MMRASSWALTVVLLALGGCVSRPSLDVALVGLAPVESSLLEQRLRVDFRLQNFGRRAVQARGVELALNVNGRTLARGVDSHGFRVEPLGETQVSAVVSTSLFEVARQLLELADRDRFSYALSGRVHLDGWPRSVSFSRGGTISRSDLSQLVGAGSREPRPLRLE